ncbi:MAG: fatty acid CoA ligase family protein [Coriobacteriia bacterium]|nr:fatty acid CoA ligase family protein [Coriobacteriia bacterium]
MNTATLLEKQARDLPDKTAIVHNDESITFKALDELINRLAHYFQRRGIVQGSKVLLFIRPSIELPAATFALFKIGAVPVFIDPGMGRKNLLRAVKEVAPIAMIAPSSVQMLARVFRPSFSSVAIKLDCAKILEASQKEESSFETYDAPEDEMAAILFTSGATGKPKGVVYTHKIFITQTALLQQMYGLTSNDVDCPCFPLFSFFTLAMGLTSFIPPIDPSKPSEIDPSAVVATIQNNNVTFAAGSPAIWMKVADYCIAHDIELPSLKSLVMFGAPVALSMHEKWQKVLPNGTTYTPYGATESLPISNISGNYILEHTSDATCKGAGVCVGPVVPPLEARIYNDDEIIVSGPVVTTEYYNEAEATRASKLSLDGALWHKVGDVGTIDEQGRIWFWGRNSHVVDLEDRKMYPIPCELVFNQLDGIKRTALVGPIIDEKVVPTLVIEMEDGSTRMTDELLGALQDTRNRFEHTLPIELFYLKRSFPVDVRHNIKIDRLALRRWVEDKAI